MKVSAWCSQPCLFLAGLVMSAACHEAPTICTDASTLPTADASVPVDRDSSTEVDASMPAATMVSLNLTDAQVLPDKLTCVATTTIVPAGVFLAQRVDVIPSPGICTVSPAATALPVRLDRGVYVLSFSRRFQPNGAVSDPGLAVLVRYSLDGVVQKPFSATLQVADAMSKTCTCPAFELKNTASLTDLFIGVSVPVNINLAWYIQSPTLTVVSGASVGTTCTCS